MGSGMAMRSKAQMPKPVRFGRPIPE